MDELEKARQRQYIANMNRLASPTAITVKSINDIREIINNFNSDKYHVDSVELESILKSEDNSYNVKSVSHSKSKKAIVVEEFNIIKNREIASSDPTDIEINGKVLKPKKINTVKSYSWIDQLIPKWFGGYRDGLHICWRMGEDEIRYDVLTNKLTKVTKVIK